LGSQDDSAGALVSRSYSVEDSTLHHSSDTCEHPVKAAPRHEEDRRLDDLPLDVGMRSCMGDTVPPMELSVTQSLPSRTLMIDMTQEDISSIPDVVEEPCVAFEHKGHMDLQA
jgi:hypothetical protein